MLAMAGGTQTRALIVRANIQRGRVLDAVQLVDIEKEILLRSLN
jgi:hypothetical protein